MILQRIRIIVGDARFEPGTSFPEVWRATNVLPHLYRIMPDNNSSWCVLYAKHSPDNLAVA